MTNREQAARRLAARLISSLMGLRYVGCTKDEKLYQRRLLFLRRKGVHLCNGRNDRLEGSQ